MLTKKGLSLLVGLPVAMLLGLSVWDSNAGASSPSGGKPDSVSIQIDNPTGGKPVVTLTLATMVQQLYTTISALPQMPEFQACTLELGPHYLLTFRQGKKTLTTVKAERDGCRPVSIAGEAHNRQATDAFWTQLDQAIYAATPPARPQWLTILRSFQPGQQPQVARLASAAQAQHLYNAILALPLLPLSQSCAHGPLDYQFVFHAADQAIHSALDKGCNTISLEGKYRSRGGQYSMNDQFKGLLSQTLAAVTFAPARPDQFTLSFLDRTKMDASQQMMITDTQLMQKLYAKIFTLRSARPQPDCPSEADKVANKGKFYDFAFSQWDLPVLQLSTYEGSCTLIEINGIGQFLQGDRQFWDLVHRAASQG